MTLGNTWSVIIRSTNKKRRLHISSSISLYSWKKATPGHLQCPCWQQDLKHGINWGDFSRAQATMTGVGELELQRWRLRRHLGWWQRGRRWRLIGLPSGARIRRLLSEHLASFPCRRRTISTSHWWNSPIYLSIQRCGSEYEDTSSCLWDHNINISHTYGCGLKCGYG